MASFSATVAVLADGMIHLLSQGARREVRSPTLICIDVSAAALGSVWTKCWLALVLVGAHDSVLTTRQPDPVVASG